MFQIHPNTNKSNQTPIPIIINNIPRPPIHRTPKTPDPYYHPFGQLRHPRYGLIPPALFHPPQTHQVPKTSFNQQDFDYRMKEIGLYIGIGMQGLIILVLTFLLCKKRINDAATTRFVDFKVFLS